MWRSAGIDSTDEFINENSNNQAKYGHRNIELRDAGKMSVSEFSTPIEQEFKREKRRIFPTWDEHLQKHLKPEIVRFIMETRAKRGHQSPPTRTSPPRPSIQTDVDLALMDEPEPTPTPSPKAVGAPMEPLSPPIAQTPQIEHSEATSCDEQAVELTESQTRPASDPIGLARSIVRSPGALDRGKVDELLELVRQGKWTP
ncbi:hypothetical protein J8273_6285 [Carpediemonas membranifera]|uniref:Uncharacterized protein n=1 Tax=Carpediemonas membranifera TaxID=201153 RepID=A0A8J6BVL1_9EUKA|nr:hypothetical protein J8273_6285 [Carpediemonas membranifera]|eukprot:KAG9391521.1 hypothetical protein J8273_6285 [Carpediemonas membranifera]